MSTQEERRRQVRVKPIPELPVRVSLVDSGPVRDGVDVVDISVGGMALSTPTLPAPRPGHRFRALVALGGQGEFTMELVIRWVRPMISGVELVDADQEVVRALGRYVAELLERGPSF